MEHYEIAEAFPGLREFSKMEYRGEHLYRFQNRGNIRIVGKGIVEIEKMPTEAQFEKLSSYFRENIDRIIVVGIGRDGMNFNAGTNPSIIIEGIRDYFSLNRRNQNELPVLKKGSSGDSVKALQILLIGYNPSCGTYGADGDFGSATEKAVKAFQSERGLVSDGHVGPKTWAKLLGLG